jgi:hypothetical protein
MCFHSCGAERAISWSRYGSSSRAISQVHLDLLKLAFEHTNWTLPPVELGFRVDAPAGILFERVLFVLKEEHWFLDPTHNSPDARQFRAAAYSMCGVNPEDHIRGEVLFAARPGSSSGVSFPARFIVGVEETCSRLVRHSPSLVRGTVAWMQGMSLCERVHHIHRASMFVIPQSSEGIVIPFMSPGSVVIYIYAPLTLLPEWKTLGWQSDVRFLEYLPHTSEVIQVRY